MRIPAPVYGAMHELRYQEDHSGIPVKIRLFVWTSRMVAFLIIALPLALSEYVIPAPFSFIPFAAYWVIGTVFAFLPNTRVDIFLPLGFRLFKRFIEVK